MNSQPRSWISRSTWVRGTRSCSAPSHGVPSSWHGSTTQPWPSTEGQPRSGPACPCPPICLSTGLAQQGLVDTHLLQAPTETLEDTLHVATLLHGDDACVVLLIDPDQEGLLIVVPRDRAVLGCAGGQQRPCAHPATHASPGHAPSAPVTMGPVLPHGSSALPAPMAGSTLPKHSLAARQTARRCTWRWASVHPHEPLRATGAGSSAVGTGKHCRRSSTVPEWWQPCLDWGQQHSSCTMQAAGGGCEAWGACWGARLGVCWSWGPGVLWRCFP